MKRTELEICITWRRALAILALVLLLPVLALTGERDAKLSQFLPSPAAIFRTLKVPGDWSNPVVVGTGLKAASSGRTVLLGANNNGKVEVGIDTLPANPAQHSQTKLHVRGNLQVTGCIHLGHTFRCEWAEN